MPLHSPIPANHLTYIELALQYKQICLQTLQRDLAKFSGPARIVTIAKALALTLDEVRAYGTTDLSVPADSETDGSHLGHNGRTYNRSKASQRRTCDDRL
jgi:hypothetical protein